MTALSVWSTLLLLAAFQMKNFILRFDMKRPSHFICCEGNSKPMNGHKSAPSATTTLVPSSVEEMVLSGVSVFSTTKLKKSKTNIYAKDVQCRGNGPKIDTANSVTGMNVPSVPDIAGVIVETKRLISLIPSVTSAKGTFVLHAAKAPGHFHVPFNVSAVTSLYAETAARRSGITAQSAIIAIQGI